MTKCSSRNALFQPELFSGVKGRKMRVNFNGGDISSDGGLLLLRQVDSKLKILPRMAKILQKYDSRQEGKIAHDIHSMLVQRVFGIACGYADLNDHQQLRHDPAWQTAANKFEDLASAPTLCRFENSAARNMCMELSHLMIDIFIESFDEQPGEIILDFDNTDDPVHGNQDGKFFHGYYDHYCFLPLYVYSGQKLITAFLQPSDQDGAKHAGAVLKMIVTRLREKWPEVKIIYRGDSGFARKRHLFWCERNNVGYIVGIAKNDRLKRRLAALMQTARETYKTTGEKSKKYCEFTYSAGSWNTGKRKVIGKAEVNSHGENPRFILTNLAGAPKDLYENVYCARGDMENRIKEQQLGLFSDRTSARYWWTNQFRVLLSGFAYILFQAIRERGVKNTDLEAAQVDTIRIKLLKIGAVITRNTRSIWFNLSSSCPSQALFWKVAEAFAPG